jgi:AraC-like DNA-binding protein
MHLERRCMKGLVEESQSRLTARWPYVLASGTARFEREVLADRRLRCALEFILKHPMGQLRMKDLAVRAGMSRSAFAKRFAAAVGIPPMQFVRSARLRYAAELLASTARPVKAIAGIIGYGSRSQFCRAFRRSFDLDPSAFRRRHRALPFSPHTTSDEKRS